MDELNMLGQVAPETKDDQMVDKEKVMKRYGAAKADKDAGGGESGSWMGMWDKLLAKFEGRLLYTKKPWQSDIGSTELYKAVTKMVAKECKEYWLKKWWELEAVDPTQADSVKKKDRTLEIQIMGHKGRMKKWQRFSTFKYLWGAGIMKVYWDGAIAFDIIDQRQFFPEPGAETVESAAWVIHEAIVSKDYVKDMFAQGIFTEQFESGTTIDMMLQGSGEAPKGLENHNRESSSKANILEYWEDDRVVVILNKKWKVRDEANPYDHKCKPFLTNICMDSWNAIWGSGLGWNTWNTTDKLDRHTNMRLDLARLSINPPTWYGAGAGIFNQAYLDIEPGKMYKCSRINETAQMRFEGALESNNVAIDTLTKQIQQTTAIDDYALGNATPSMNDTASGVTQMSQAANERIDLYMYQNDDFCVRFIEMCSSLVEQFLHQPDGMGGYTPIPMKMSDGSGTAVVPLHKEDLQAKADILVKTPATVQNKMAQQQNEMQLYTLLQQDPQVDHKAALKSLLEAFGRDVNEYMLDDQEKLNNAKEQMLLTQHMEQMKNAMLPPQAPPNGAPAPAAGIVAPGQQNQPTQSIDQSVISNQPK